MPIAKSDVPTSHVITNADYLDYKPPPTSASGGFTDYKRDETEPDTPKVDEGRPDDQTPKAVVTEAELGPPPPFATHVSEMRIRGDGHVISHDAHLNEDGKLSRAYHFAL